MPDNVIRDTVGGAIVGGLVGGAAGAYVAGEDRSFVGKLNNAVAVASGVAAGAFVGGGVVLTGKLIDAISNPDP